MNYSHFNAGQVGSRARLAAAALGVLFSLTILLPQPAGAEVPVKLNYQGNLRQSGLLVSGSRQMIFRVYDSSSAVSPLWTSSAFTVSVSTGVFRVTLEPAIADWQSGSLWLELEVAGTRLSPREELTASPYAVNSLLHSGKKYTNSASVPASPGTGDLWLDTSAAALKYWNGAVWLAASGVGGAPGAHAATHAGGSSDAITSLGAHAVNGDVTFSVAASLRSAGQGVSVSTHLVVAGDVHAAKFYGDISGATGLPSGDNLGTHIAIQSLSMAGFNINNASGLGLKAGVQLSSTTAANYGGVYSSSHVFVNGDVHAAKFYGDISGASGLPAGDNLGTHTATQALDLAGFAVDNVSSMTLTGAGVSGSGALFNVAGSTLVALNNGNIGIGTAAPGYKLEVAATGMAGFQVDPQAGYVSLRVNGIEVARMSQ